MKEIIGKEEYEGAIYTAEKVVIEFFTPSCMVCKMNKQILEKQEANGTVVFTVDASKQENQELVEEFNIMGVPHIQAFYNSTEGDVTRAKHTVEHGLVGAQLIEDLHKFFFDSEKFARISLTQFEIKEVKGNLFELDKCELFPGTTPKDYVLAHCIASDFGMFGGIAKEFVVRKDMKRKLIQWAEENDISEDTVGGTRQSLVGKSIFIQDTYNMVTKPSTAFPPNGYASMFVCLEDVKCQMEERGQKYLAIPRIGCGIDMLDWEDVKDILEEIFGGTDIKILVVNL